jgi:hypothetical protein
MSTVHEEADRRNPSHRLVCESCRLQSRVNAAWKHVERPETPVPIAPSEEFVARVVRAIGRDRRTAARERILLAAAAALLFSFFAGLAHEQASQPRTSPEDTYASAVTPSALEGLIPN